MSSQEKLSEAFDKLNDEQRKAVETLDGPVLVVAGPGTGKTQLLSLRVVNILQNRDVGPENILCLTFTEAGAEAMTKRLSGFIGRDAYAVNIATFHSFAAQQRNHYPEYFERSVFDQRITELQAKKLVNRLLSELNVTDPLYQKPNGSVYGNYKDVYSFIEKLDQSGVSEKEVRAIIDQNEAFFTYIEEQTQLLEHMWVTLPKGGRDEKIDIIEGIRSEIAVIASSLPSELKDPVVDLPGTYIPYGEYLNKTFQDAELYRDNIKTASVAGFTDLRKKLFEENPPGFTDREYNAKMASALSIAERYQYSMKEQGLYNFNDMINDAIKAIENNPKLQRELQRQYRYIMIDEFQDTNGSQMRLVDLLSEGIEQPNILAVGDDDQAIMRFQGASVEFINQFEDHYKCDVERIVLKTNYRSTPSLVDFGQVIARQIENRSPASKTEKKLMAHKGEGEPTTFKANIFTSKEVEYYEVAREIAGLIDEGFLDESDDPNEAIAVIACTHKKLKALMPYLQHFHVPFNYRITNAVSMIDPLQTMLALMRFALLWSAGDVKRAEVLLPQIIASKEIAAEFGLEEHDPLNFAVEARGRKGWLKTLKESSDPRFRDLYIWLEKTCRTTMASSAQKALFELAEPLLHYYKQPHQQDLFETIEFNYGLKALLQFAQEENIRNSGSELHALRLEDLTAALNDADNFDVEIEVSIPSGKEQAITLTSAHSSKGLEFDLVYLLDAEDRNWHTTNRRNVATTRNMLLNNTKDEDDDRRLLFVAVTRAKRLLRIVQAGPKVIREFVDDIETEEIDIPQEDLAVLAELSWQDRYEPKGATLREIAQQALANRKLSVSLLNAFVEYPKDGDLSGESFLLKQIMHHPQPPNQYTEFGSIVHKFFEEYLVKGIKAKTATPEELIKRTHEEIDYMDFDESIIAHNHQNFDLILKEFLPVLNTMLSESARAEQTLGAEVDGILITGDVDLMLFDENERTIKVYDYKTGNASDDELDENHLRQLRFYRLLIENSPEYAGWRVLGAADLYVSPQKDLGYKLAETQFVTVSDEEIEHLRALSAAVWRRLQNGLFDTSAFLETDEYVELCIGKNGKPKKSPDKKDCQAAYEQWLIDEHRKMGLEA